MKRLATRKDFKHFLFAPVLFLFLNTATTAGPVADSLKVTVNNPVIDSTLTIRGVSGTFPNSILSTISVTDSAGNAVLGLADTARWLGPDDIALNGKKIRNIWQPLQEYHKLFRDYPRNPDIYDQLPAPKILEVRQSEQSTSSAMMIMDMSYSMRFAIDSVRSATRLFIDSLGQGDRAGLIQFHGEIGRVIDFTTDKDTLLAGVYGGKARGGTPLADALGLAIQMTKKETTPRRVIIAYTDGHEIDSKEYTIQSVIDSAKTYHIPIYMIGLGAEIQPDTLQMLATETGGEYLQSGSAADMKAIYARLSEVVKNYYVLNYSSPDPVYNNSIRLLDVHVTDQNRIGHGTGRYFVPGPGSTDLSVKITAATSDTVHVGNEVFHAAYSDSAIAYSIVVFNHGPENSTPIRLTHTLAAGTDFVSASVVPDSQDTGFLQWSIPGLKPGEVKIINVTVIVRSDVTADTEDLVSSVEIYSNKDTASENNRDMAVVKYLGTYPRYDGALAMPIETPGKFIAGGFEFGRVTQNETYSYRLKVYNNGNQPIAGAILHNWIPDSVNINTVSTNPSVESGDALAWNLPTIAAKDSFIIEVTAQLADDMPVGSFPLPHKAELEMLQDQEPENNFAEETIYAVILQENSDLAVSLTSQTDSVLAGRNAVIPGETYTYSLTVTNNGPGSAQEITVNHSLPPHVVFAEGDFAGTTRHDWLFDDLTSGSSKSVDVKVKVALTVPASVKELVSRATITSPIDTIAWNNSASDTVSFISVPPEELWNYDLAIDTEVLTDTSVIIGGETQPAARPGSVYRYKLKITNAGPGTARDVRVINTLPENVTYFQVSKETDYATLSELSWRLDALRSGEREDIIFYARVANSLSQMPLALQNRAEVVAAKDTVAQNNISISTIYAVDGATPQVDVAVQNFVRGNSFNYANGDTVWFADENSTYQYAVQIFNNSESFADSVYLNEILPQGATPVPGSYSVPPEMTGNPSQWFFEAIEPHGRRRINFSMAVPPASDSAFRTFIHTSEVRAANEANTNLADNSDTARIYSVKEIPEPEIAVSPQTALVGDSVRISVRASIELKSWNLLVYTADNRVDDTFADQFIAATPLQPGEWIDVTPFYRNVRLFTEAKEEIIRFELVTVDFLNNLKRVSVDLTVRARNAMVLERNIFRAGRESRFGINFELSSNRNVRLDLYDLSGTLITKIEEGPYLAGHNTYYWDGFTNSGQRVGSGVYLVTLRSGEYTSWKKMVVVQ